MTPPIDAAAYAGAEDALARVLDTQRDVTIIQGEAILVLEQVARGLGGPGVRALNLVSGPYGEALGDWLAVGGADVTNLGGALDRALSVEEVRTALADGPYDVVSVVHAEAATGAANPLAEIARLVHASGAVLAVDAVASVGAEPLAIDAWDLDLVMLGPQKSMAGPAGVCALVASERGWAQIAANPAAPRGSILSLLDWKERWLDSGRAQIPGYAHQHEMRAMIQALDVLADDVGLTRTIERHRRAAAAVRAACPELGLAPWVANEREAAGVVTLVQPPAGVTVEHLIGAASPWCDPSLLAPAPGPLADRAVRINHTGDDAAPAAVLSVITALGLGASALDRAPNLDRALAAAARALH